MPSFSQFEMLDRSRNGVLPRHPDPDPGALRADGLGANLNGHSGLAFLSTECTGDPFERTPS